MRRARSGASGWTPPEVLDEYRLVRPLGKGSMGQVYLAEDTLLERAVAVKFIAQRHPDEAARRRFTIEARAVARLSHPNVVVVHRSGEVDGRPYLVTELVRGASLADLKKPVPFEKALAIGLGMARGLAAAHRRDVLHRDIKPANIMLADDGEVKLLDFGLAKIANIDVASTDESRASVASRESGERSIDGRIAGTPLYMAPEVLSGEPASPRSDVYAAGAVLYELCAGGAPRDTLPPDVGEEIWIAGEADSARVSAPGIDVRFAAVIDRCLARSPALRFASAEALCDALAAIAPETTSAAIPEGNPYRGLTAFGAEHRALFFGRASEARAVLDRLRAGGLVVVTGDSGVGKSSLCRAGVLPLVADGALDDGRRALVVSIVPGRRPIETLALALGSDLGLDEAALSRAVRSDPSAFARVVRAALGKDRGLVLFVDQLEELLTLAGAEDAAAFARALTDLGAASAGVRILVAVRGDYFTRLAALPGLGEELGRSLYLLRPLSHDGMRAAITGPAAQKGVGFEPESLVDVLAKAAGTAGGLPLLQFALAELWEAKGKSAAITASALASIGGVEGALTRHADEVLFALPAESRAAARPVLLRLLTAEGTRARRTGTELGTENGAARTALEALVRGRLVVARDSEGETAYEVAHEALLERWSTLRAWMDETREEAALLHEIERAADLWLRRGRRDEETWAGDALGQAVHRVEKARLDLPANARAFLDAGIRRQRAAQSRRRRLLVGGASALAIIAVASTAAAVAFAEKERQAVRQQEQIRLAAADMGSFDLSIEPFDWDAERQKAIPAPVASTLDVRLCAVSSDDAHSPGRCYGPDDLRRSNRRVEGNTLREHVEARSGPAFLEVTGRGEGCLSSWVYLQRLPGYTDRASQTVFRVMVPTCRASSVDMVEIPAGDFYRGVPVNERSEEWRDEQASLPTFHIDRTEVTRGAYAVYEAMEAITGETPARTAYLDLDRPGGERLPIVGLNAFMAASYCRFMGKELPSSEQWLKAMRGGLTLDGRPNPDPKRNQPWVTTTAKHPRNIMDPTDGDGFPNLAPVDAFPEDKSPYGVLGLGGNVREWTRAAVHLPGMKGLRFVLGSSWDSPPEHAHWGNMRPDRYLDFAIGVRCAKR
ncbi:Hypothetical protein A7982_10290 [Minicystis rosea]|nr:Hypothetical protein A7982_10290 [Minicystis rosea]